jgi:hypothetical protein
MATSNKPQQVGENIQVETTEDEIIIRIKRDYDGGPSTSGKTLIVASSKGNKQVTQDGIILGLNAYRYRK